MPYFVANTTSIFGTSCPFTSVSSCSLSCACLPTKKVSIVYCWLVKLTTSHKVILLYPIANPLKKTTLSWDKWIKVTQAETQMSPLDISDNMWHKIDTHSDSSPQWSQNQTVYFSYDCQCQDSTVLSNLLSIPLPEPMNPFYNNTMNYRVHKPTKASGYTPSSWEETGDGPDWKMCGRGQCYIMLW